MKFHPVYYIINGWPSIERTVEIIDKYVEHNVRAVQIDMPSTNPYGESQYIKDRMAYALDKYGLNYDLFMDNIREVRRRHPDLEIHIVVYPDVVEAIGLKKFAEFCKEIGSYTIRDGNVEYVDWINKEYGLRISNFVFYYLPESDILRAAGNGNLTMLRSNKDHPEWVPRDGLHSWTDRVAYIRNRGVEGPVFAVAGILTKEQLEDVKAAKADGAYIGTTLMKLWDDEEALWKLLDELESVAER